MDNRLQDKIQKFEEFIDGRLKPDLVKAIDERDKVFKQQKIFSNLKKNIENLQKNSVTSLSTMVNIGSEVYVQTDVPDTQQIFVDVGLGFYVEFSWVRSLGVVLARNSGM